MQTKVTIIYHTVLHSEMAKIKDSRIPSVSEDMEKLEPSWFADRSMK